MGLLRRWRKPDQQSVQKMLQLASSFGQRAVEQYRTDVNRLGLESQLGGELKARLLGAAVPTVVHNRRYGVSNWSRVGSSMALHTLSIAAAEAVPNQEDMWVNPEELAVHGRAALLCIDQQMVWHLSQLYQSAILDSCEDEDHLQQLKTDEQLKQDLLSAAAAFVEELLSTYTAEARLALK